MPTAQSWASSDAVRAVMRANTGRDTAPELALRRELHRAGLRYRVGMRPVPALGRTADVVFTRKRLAVFVDGCFWHGCPDHYRPARTHSEFWSAKLASTRLRDADTDARLAAAGWEVLRFWEHDDPESAARTIEALVRGPADSTNGQGR